MQHMEYDLAAAQVRLEAGTGDASGRVIITVMGATSTITMTVEEYVARALASGLLATAETVRRASSRRRES